MEEIFEQSPKHTNPWLFALQLGFYAGLIWGGLKLLAYYLNFTRVVPGFMVEPFFRHRFLTSPAGELAGWGFFIAFSIVAALLYAAVLRKAKGPWPGLAYGVAWWIVWFLLVGPWTGAIQRLGELDANSICTELCLFVLWGLFIGYTITFEFTEEREAEAAS